MKTTPEEKERRRLFEPGIISRDGFLGNDSRHIHDMIEEDFRALSGIGIGKEQVADCLQYFIEEGKKGLGSKIDTGDFEVSVQWDRGMLPCPFQGCGLHHKIVVTVTHKKKNKTITYSQLNVHMIRIHGFFEGKGGAFRLEPNEIIPFLCLIPQYKDRREQE